ncbi:rod shape-determining protein RodA [Novispirillum itersonii]|uniref:rod shape-determining protein RodA n=1 Tax=Novispirillum itersonii TaxID=189 RepID=UPI0003763424|nr:rod shape-determining protein RodA [Novispirillum itersonii]
MGFRSTRLRKGEMTLTEKLWHISWTLILLVTMVASVGFLMLYSAAEGNLSPWADKQMIRFGVGVVFLLFLSMIDIRHFMRYAYAFYTVALVLLVAVEVKGTIGMGAQRWVDLGLFQLQPSELMKIALVLTLARYFHGADVDTVRRISFLIPPALLIAMPAVLVLKQPDLGTAMMLMMGGVVLFLVAGVPLWIFFSVGAVGLAAVPVVWEMLRDYQKNRVLTFLDPDRDPLGTGYHITQSKIALGSGGVFGKGYMLGTQSHLDFLPEHQTDFIFTMLGEEFGMVGGVTLLGLYVLILAYGFYIAARCRHHFGRLVAIGVTTTFFLYVFINIAMVMGLLPVVGIPLPLISYGGTAMMTLMIGFGVLMSVHVHRDVQISRSGGFDD